MEITESTRSSAAPDETAAGRQVVPERRTAERRAPARRSSQSVVRQIVERLADGIVVVSAQGTIRFANPAAEKLFGRSAAELVDQEFGFPLSSADATEIEIVRRDGALVVSELRVVDVAWEDENAMLVSLRDVTDRKVAEEKSRQLEREKAARAEAEAANRAKSDFLAVMSHELRTPLNAVIGYAELLDLGVAGSLGAEQRQQVGRIVASGRHLLGLVNEILDLAKVEAGRLAVERVPTSAADVVEGAIVLAQPQAEARGLTLSATSEITPTMRFIGDRDRVLQILANLLSNAVKFTEPGGTIRIDVTDDEVPADARHLQSTTHWIAFHVRDSGIGIHADHIDRIFSPFVQAEQGHTRRSDGTGLGLTISRRLARLMRGDVTVESTVGVGSQFTLWLPADLDGQVRPAGAGEQLAAPLPSRTRGLAAVGDSLMHEIEHILDAFVARLRTEPSMPAAPTLKYSQLADHVGAMLADIAAALVTLEDSEGAPTMLLADSADLQRFIADRHGSQRARLGWTVEALARENAVLQEEVERSIRHCFRDPSCASQAEEAVGVARRYLEQGAETSRRALERSAHRSGRRRSD
jgi:signal transduction histidine kinase